MTEQYSIALLPYLHTSQPVTLRGITLRNNADSSHLAPDIAQDIQTLQSMFFLKDDLQIQNMTHATFDDSDSSFTYDKWSSRLRQLQTLLCYLYSSPHPTLGDPFLRLEHSSIYMFKKGRFSPYLIWPEHNVSAIKSKHPQVDKFGEISGYECLVNWRSHIWVNDESRIYPPVPSLWLNISQDI